MAAIHGYALGGGLENALGCHYRIAVPSAKVGLPEVLIGILPAGDGTQRLPRPIGPEAALEMIVSGRHVRAPEALALGILDEPVDGPELRDAAVAFAMRVMDAPVLPRVSEREVPDHDPGIFEAMRRKIARRARGQRAPRHCIRCVEIACSAPFEEGLRQERALFEELENSEEAKALPEQVDKATVEFGYPMGPFAVGDLAGLDIGYAGRKRREAADPTIRRLPIADALVEQGRLGMKTGAGWYRYETGSRTPHPDPEVTALIRRISGESGVEQQEFDDGEIVRRLLFSSVNEACRIIEEGIARHAVEVDTMWLYGFGFPRYRGGLMYWADTIGVREVYDRAAAWHQRYGERWAPAPLLRRLAESGTPLREAAANM